MANYEAYRKLKRIVTFSLVGFAVVLVVAICSFVAFGNARRKNAEYEAMIASLEARKASLENGISDVSAYVEQQAREQYGMIKDGETLYIYK